MKPHVYSSELLLQGYDAREKRYQQAVKTIELLNLLEKSEHKQWSEGY